MLKRTIANIKHFVNRLFNFRNVEVTEGRAAKVYKEVFSELYNEVKDKTSITSSEVRYHDGKLGKLVDKPSDVFNAALDYLWDGVGSASLEKQNYICTSISFTSYTTPVQNFCKDIISERLNGESTLEGWLITKGHATDWETYSNPEKLQETRRQWLISLRDEFKAKGM